MADTPEKQLEIMQNAVSAHREHAFGRRAFLAGATSLVASAVMPIVAGQRIPDEQNPTGVASPYVAYAEDAGTFEFEIAKPSEIAIKVVDVRIAGKPGVKGAKVTLKSLDTDADAITVTTNDKGIVLVDIEKFCDSKNATDDIKYLCDLSVKIRADGCRQVDIESRQAIGGTAFVLPTCSIDNDNYYDPYLRSISFNGNDVQYTTTTFLHSAGNGARHEISAELYLKDFPQASVQIWRWTPKSDVFPGCGADETMLVCDCDASISQAQAEANKRLDEADAAAIAAGRSYDVEPHENRWIRKISVKERFLQTGYDGCFRAGDRLVVRVCTNRFGTDYLTSAKFVNAPLDKVYSGAADYLPGIGTASLEFVIPKVIPGIGGSKFSVWTPTFSFLFAINPMGYLMAGYLPFLKEGETTDKNPFNGDKWETWGIETYKEQREYVDNKYEKRKDAFKTMYNEWKSPSGENKTKRMQYKVFPKFELSASAQLFADLTYDIDDMIAGENVWRGAVNMAAGVSGEANITFQVLLGPIPLFLSLCPSADATFSLRAGWIANWPSDDKSFEEKLVEMVMRSNLSWADNQVAIVMNIGLAVVAGIGMSGVASIGVRGSAGITCYLGLYDGSGHGAEGDYVWPHARVGAGVDLTVCAQLYLLKYSKKILGKEWPTLYDSWGIKAEASSLGNGEDEPESRSTGKFPAEFALNSGSASLGDDGDLEPEDDGSYVISLAELAEKAQCVTEKELIGVAEFGEQAAEASGFGTDDENAYELVVNEIQEDELTPNVGTFTTDDGEVVGTVACYSLKLVSRDEKEEASVAAAAVPSDAEAENGAADAGSAAEEIGGNSPISDDADAASGSVEASSDADKGADDASNAEATAAGVVVPANSKEDDANGAATDGSNSQDANGEGLNVSKELPSDNGEADSEAGQIELKPVKTGCWAKVAGADAASVAGFGETGSVRPSVDAHIREGAYSDGRPRLVHVGTGNSKTDIMLRIAAKTRSNGDPRTQLVAQTREPDGWSFDIPIYFDTKGLGVKDEDLFDYDFDVCECDGQIIIMLLSGTRPQGFETDLLTACTNSITTVLSLGRLANGNLCENWSRSWRSFDGGANYGGSDGELYFAYSPCISNARLSLKDRGMGGISDCFIVGGFIYKRAKGDAVLADKTPAHAMGFAFRVPMYDYTGKISTPWGGNESDTLIFKIRDASSGKEVPESVTRLVAGGGDAYYTNKGTIEHANVYFGFESAEGCGTYRINPDFDCVSDVFSVRNYFAIAAIAGAKKIYPWLGGAERFLVVNSDDVVCQVAPYGRGNANPVPISPYREQTDVDGKKQIVCDIPPSFAVTADGTMLIFTDNKQGIDGFEYDGIGQDEDPTPHYEDDGRYRIMASRAVTHTVGSKSVTLFTKPFPLCELGHAIDQVTSAVIDGAKIRIVASVIMSLIDSKADYYEIQVPVIACATATAMTTESGTIFPGADTNFEITLRNDGNSRLSSVTLALREGEDGGAALGDPQTIDLGPDTVVFCSGAKAAAEPGEESMADPVFDSNYHNNGLDAAAFNAHPLVVNDGRNCLAPNCTAVVKMSVKVPKTWTGKKKLRVDVAGFTFADPVSGTACAVSLGENEVGVTADCSESGVASISAFEVKESDDQREKVEVELAVGENGSSGLDRLNGFAAYPMKEGDTPSDPSNPGGGNGGNSGSGNGNGGGNGSGSGSGNGSGSGKFASTGDTSLGLGGLSALAGLGSLAALGFTAYSQRRTQLESGEQPTDDNNSADE